VSSGRGLVAPVGAGCSSLTSSAHNTPPVGRRPKGGTTPDRREGEAPKLLRSVVAATPEEGCTTRFEVSSCFPEESSWEPKAKEGQCSAWRRWSELPPICEFCPVTGSSLRTDQPPNTRPLWESSPVGV